MVLEIDNVELYFKNKCILNGIYLKAETGKVTGVLGRNGCGKSSILDIAFGNLKPKYKLIRIDNEPVLKPLYIFKRVMYLPQYNFIPTSLKLNKLFQIFKVNWKEFSMRYQQFSDYKNQKFGNISSGERRFIEAYIILKAKNEIIFLDEPFNGIAPIFVEEVKLLIAEEKPNKIIILTDHRYNDVIESTDTLYLLSHGSTKLIQKLTELEDYGYLSSSKLQP